MADAFNLISNLRSLVFVGQLLGVEAGQGEFLPHTVMYFPADVLHGLCLHLELGGQYFFLMLHADFLFFLVVSQPAFPVLNNKQYNTANQ